ncbi:MAG: hypothetical protein J6V75_03145 [Bacteroidaceae bacterium]|nr:hypothetical protein [Bacteroidaceae bacterium]
MKRLIIIIAAFLSWYSMNAQKDIFTPAPTERLNGDVSYYEETTYNIWTLRLFSGPDQKGEQTTQTIKRPQSITCHRFDSLGRETVITRYVQRNASVGSIGRDSLGNVDFIANEISRITPDTRTVMSYDGQGRLCTTKTWSFNLADSTLTQSDSCLYDSTGVLYCMQILRDSLPVPNNYQRQDRNGSYTISYYDGTYQQYRFDSEHCLVRYRDREGKTVRYYYNERCNIIRQVSEWENGSTLNMIFDDYEYDDYGNWTRCSQNEKDPGMPSRSLKIIERTYNYR